MGELKNTNFVKILGYTIALALSSLNLWILFQALF
jgi:Mn2+/Fe2+ NRAMP family transporter